MELLHGPVDGPAGLRSLLNGQDPVVAAGCTDPFSGRLAEAAGFECVYLTGNGASAVRLGRPDVGLMTLTEMVDQAARVVDAVGVPVIADADTGYGNQLNVIRTVQLYERAGVAAFHLEDQMMPKRCGHLAGKQLVPAAEHAAKIRAAVAARTRPETIIIGRTDAVSVEGLDAALDRAASYGQAGADALFVEGLQNESAITRAVSELSEWPLVFAWVEGKVPPLSPTELGALGVRLVIFPVTGVLASMKALDRAYRRLRTEGTSVGFSEDLSTFDEFSSFMGAQEAADIEQRFAAD